MLNILLKKVTLKTFEKNQHIVIEVKDNGLGIPQELKDKILMPFFTTKDIGKGTGLGLSISKGIIEEHSGTLSYENKMKNRVGTTTFKIVGSSN